MFGAQDQTRAQSGPTGRAWLFCIPMQIGPATEYAKGQKYWLARVVVIQMIMLLARAVVVGDTLGSLWMAVTIMVGVYSYQHQMNISYVCAWGMMCGVNGVLDVLVFVGAAAGDEDGMSLFVRILVFVSYMCGAGLARHLYIDYALAENVPVREWSRICDPFGTFADKFDKSGGNGEPLKGNAASKGQRYGGAEAPPPSDRAAAFQAAAAGGGNQASAAAAAGAGSAAQYGQSGAAAAAQYGQSARDAAANTYAQYNAQYNAQYAAQPAAQAPEEDRARLQPVGSNPFMTGPLRPQDTF